MRTLATTAGLVAVLAVAGCGGSNDPTTLDGVTAYDATIVARDAMDDEAPSSGTSRSSTARVSAASASGSSPRGARPGGLVDGEGVRRVCVRLKSTGSTTWRRCDPEGAPPPAAPAYEEETGEPA